MKIVALMSQYVPPITDFLALPKEPASGLGSGPPFCIRQLHIDGGADLWYHRVAILSLALVAIINKQRRERNGNSSFWTQRT